MNSVLSGIRVVEQGTFITGSVRRNDAGRSRRRRRQGRESRRAIRIAPTRAGSSRRTSRPTTATSAASRSISTPPRIARVFDDLIASADVYIQNFRPGTAERLGAGRQRLQELNPALDLLLDQRLRRERPVRGSAELRLGGAGAERLSQRRRRSGAAALSRARRWPMRSPASTRRTACSARCSSAAAPGAAGSSRSRCSRRWRISPSSRSRRSSRSIGRRQSSDRPRLAQAYILRTADGGLIAIHLSSLEKFWEGLVERAGGAADRRRRALPHAPGAHRQLRGARRRARRAVLASPAAALGRAARRERRAVRADQSHRRGRAGPAGAAPRPGRAGRACARRQAGRPPGGAVRRRARDARDDCAAARRARRRHSQLARRTATSWPHDRA